MYRLDLSADQVVAGLLQLSISEPVALLDSCGIGHSDSHLLIAGIRPVRNARLSSENPDKALAEFDDLIAMPDTAAIFTIPYDFGLKLLGIETSDNRQAPEIDIQLFKNLIVHDYDTGITRIEGEFPTSGPIEAVLVAAAAKGSAIKQVHTTLKAVSNFSRDEYLNRIERIKSHIRRGNTYQTNLTQQFLVETPESTTPQSVFSKLRESHPAAFAVFILQNEDYVLSISPERFLRISTDPITNLRTITASPIKGTRKRGGNKETDENLRSELLASSKDRAENTMIVDLIRNDLGRVCEYGSVEVAQLCNLEEHPTLFHLVSTVKGTLREEISISDVLRAVFPSGSITGCPKISTMQLIEALETVPRGLSMGAIGYSGFDKTLDLNVAIRTMVIQNGTAEFNVGGGVVIDSDPDAEYRESLLKAEALFRALNVVSED